MTDFRLNAYFCKKSNEVQWVKAIANPRSREVFSYQAQIVHTLEPVVATFISFLFLGEQLGVRGVIGAGLVVTATVLSQSKH